MPGLKPDFRYDAVHERVLEQTAGLPPEARPGAASKQRVQLLEDKAGHHAEHALRSQPMDENGLT